MDSRFLQSFVSVVELGSIAEAARHLHLTSATIAQRLRALESDVGSKLVERSGRTVKPTVAGTRIMDSARAVLREVRDLTSAASGTDYPAGPLQLGSMPTALTGLVPQILRDWMYSHPDIEIHIEPATSSVLYSHVISGHIDAAVLVHPMFELPKSCAWSELHKEPLVLLAPAGMVVDDALQTLAKERFIQYDRQAVAGRMADDYLRKHGVRPKVLVELDFIQSIAKFVAEGLGVSVVPDWVMAGPLDPALKKHPLPAPVPVRTVGILWQRSATRVPLVEAFVAIARKHCGNA